MKTSEQVDKLAEALAKAQGEFTPIERTRTVTVNMKSGGSYTFDYAPLDVILHATMPALAKNGLSVAWSADTEYKESSQFVTAEVMQTCRLMHASGQWQEASVRLRTTETSPQGLGSVLTYGRRYSFEHVVGVVSETDDDGAAASGHESQAIPRQRREPLPACPSCGKQDAVIVGKAEYGGGLVCFDKKGGCKHSWGTEQHPLTNKDGTPKAPPSSNGKKPTQDEDDKAYKVLADALHSGGIDDITGQTWRLKAINAITRESKPIKPSVVLKVLAGEYIPMLDTDEQCHALSAWIAGDLFNAIGANYQGDLDALCNQLAEKQKKMAAVA